MADEERSFKEEYMTCLKDRDAQYLKHDKAEQAWSKERAELKSRIEVLETRVEGLEIALRKTSS